MKLTRERKIYAAVLALGLGVLGYDQLGRSASDRASAASADAQPTMMMATAPSSSSNKQNTTPGSTSDDSRSLAARLSELAVKTGPTSPEQIRDAFMPSAAWAGKGLDTGARLDRAAADKFVQSHKLASVATSASGDVAVVDGQLLRVGSMLDGFKLVAVSRTAALFDAGNGVQARLSIASGPTAPTASGR